MQEENLWGFRFHVAVDGDDVYAHFFADFAAAGHLGGASDDGLEHAVFGLPLAEDFLNGFGCDGADCGHVTKD